MWLFVFVINWEGRVIFEGGNSIIKKFSKKLSIIYFIIGVFFFLFCVLILLYKNVCLVLNDMYFLVFVDFEK